jgi:prolyl-tRNA editing enzyme YbaK/EbsC (Cys-tRNA(Pro) deacylase)
VLNCAKVIVGGGSRDRKIYVDPQTLAALPSSEVIKDLAKERPT